MQPAAPNRYAPLTEAVRRDAATETGEFAPIAAQAIQANQVRPLEEMRAQGEVRTPASRPHLEAKRRDRSTPATPHKLSSRYSPLTSLVLDGSNPTSHPPSQLVQQFAARNLHSSLVFGQPEAKHRNPSTERVQLPAISSSIRDSLSASKPFYQRGPGAGFSEEKMALAKLPLHLQHLPVRSNEAFKTAVPCSLA